MSGAKVVTTKLMKFPKSANFIGAANFLCGQAECLPDFAKGFRKTAIGVARGMSQGDPRIRVG